MEHIQNTLRIMCRRKLYGDSTDKKNFFERISSKGKIKILQKIKRNEINLSEADDLYKLSSHFG